MIFFLLIWSISSLAMIALASAMSKHQKQIYGHELAKKTTLFATLSGWGLLFISLIICLMSGKPSSMLSLWVGILTFSALFVGSLLSYYSTKIKTVAIICLIVSCITGIILLV
ncbi:DUF3325 domain-containing protein [Acinetobacter bereziniae]|uniref:DUF3325 domain-containing protein n=1 Tax=Acinetobacter bereziniae TaxID=106648 RepID=UPI00301913B1